MVTIVRTRNARFDVRLCLYKTPITIGPIINLDPINICGPNSNQKRIMGFNSIPPLDIIYSVKNASRRTNTKRNTDKKKTYRVLGFIIISLYNVDK